ncbi:MAG: cation-transporting ATPase, partial [Candidatus Kerfeldbacteria bacterium CG_4_10_14_0_8_um_filter_42_10]
MNFSPYTKKTTAEIETEFGTNIRSGLSEQKAEQRLVKYGHNELEAHEVNWWQILKRQFISPFIYLLIAAAALALALKEVIDALMILMFVVINAFLGFYQEYRSENTVKLLKKYVVRRARVIRHGRTQVIDSALLVPGDVVIVETGDFVPADLRLMEEYDLMADETTLTGESVPVKKISGVLPKPTSQIFKASNICFSGTIITSGKGTGIVIATGKKSVIGDIAQITGKTTHTGTFQKDIASFSKFILRLVLITLTFLFVANLFLKGFDSNIGELAIFSVALAVSVIPEALPMVMTFSLSSGALRLAKNNVVVKRLSAIEDLGSVEVLCTDKTGTLTENNLTVKESYSHRSGTTGKPVTFYASLAAPFIKENEQEPNNAFDLALYHHLGKTDRDSLNDYKQIAEIPFDPERSRNTVIVQKKNDLELITRGALEKIMPLCKKMAVSELKAINQWAAKAGRQGQRVIAVASKKLTKQKNNILKEENGLTFEGLISFVDPIKKTTRQSIHKAKILGVKVKILTGDSREVAGAVAYQIGLTKSIEEVITGEELEFLSHSQQHEAVQKHSVFARVSPEQKYKIIHLLQEKHEVGFLGEGINDAPALKIANVGLAVQHASDIAQETADIVLLNKSLGVIINGIEEGRRVFANSLKYIKATLASNFGNFFAVAIASLMIDFLPMLPLQILLLNL